MAAAAWQLARYKLPTALEQRLCTPSLVIYADVLRQNVERVIKACGGARRWQPHIKTVKSKAIIEELGLAGRGAVRARSEGVLRGPFLESRRWVVSFSILSRFGPRRARLRGATGETSSTAPERGRRSSERRGGR